MSLHREWRNMPDGKFWRQEMPGGLLMEVKRLADGSLTLGLLDPHTGTSLEDVLYESSAESLLQWLDRSRG